MSPGTRRSSSRQWQDAKTDFSKSLQKALQELNSIASQERAANILLNRLVRGTVVDLDDSQIFETMRVYGIGYEQARQVLSVAMALERVSLEKDVSVTRALDELTLRLSVVATLEPTTTTTAPLRQDELRVSSPSTPVTIVPPVSDSGKPHKSMSVTKPSSCGGGKVVPTKPLSKKEIAKTAGRKRSLDETTTKTTDSRARVDSVSEEVNAKLAENAPLASGAAIATSKPRTKRSRSEERETPSLKRAPTKPRASSTAGQQEPA